MENTTKPMENHMKIESWKLVTFDEDNNQINVDVHSNDVASHIDDSLTLDLILNSIEEFEESEEANKNECYYNDYGLDEWDIK